MTSDEEEAALLKAVFARHPAISHFRSNPLVSMVHLPALRRSDRNEANFVHRWRWRFGVALAFWRKAQLEGVLLLHREESDGDYTSNERERLGQLHSQLEKALCRIISGRRQEAEKKALASILKPLPLPLVLCDWRLRIICESADGLKARAAWELGEDRARSMIFSPQRKLPPELAEFCRARIMMWEKAGPRRRRLLEKEELEMRHPLRPQVRVYVRLAREKTVPMIRPFFFLRFETQSAEDQGRQIRADNLASLAQLSAAERELALLVCRGHSNGAIAQQLGKSVYTIKAQLHSIFAKLKVQRRSQLVALLIRTSVPLLACFSFDLFDALISGV